MSKLARLTQAFRGKRIAVLGDLVADVFVYGEIARISREAPVLVLNHRETQVVPGGGANAIHNLAMLEAKPIPIGVVGEDAEGQQLLEQFSKMGVDISGITVAKTYRTPSKMRILAGAAHSQRQQMVRLDSGAPLDDEKVRSSVERKAKSALKDADALLISDYGYTLVTPEMISRIRPLSLLTTLDSRFNLMSFAGLSAATPNEPEAEVALGVRIGTDGTKLEWAGRTLLRKLRHEAILLTRGKDGMSLFERGKKTVHIPVYGTDEVADVTGAGDTVIATFTLALAAGASFGEAAHLANLAGGIVVMKYGTRPVLFQELLKAASGAGI